MCNVISYNLVSDVQLPKSEGTYKVVKTCQWSQWYTGQCEGPCSNDNEKRNSGVREFLRRKIIQTSIEIWPLDNGENFESKGCVGTYTRNESCITSRCTSPGNILHVPRNSHHMSMRLLCYIYQIKQKQM